ncbi:YueI family protein [Priestia aryabhattai]|uniref:YueI family protein n=1 Tax=Priestia aryabhattai TaxID=412384 RepID=UPI003981C472
MSDQLEEYLERGMYGGMYGAKETKRDERRYFLTALRENIELALKKGQVMKKDTAKIKTLLKKVKDGHLFLNGSLSYSYLSPYIQAANQHKVPFTIVQNLEADTDIGLVLTGSEGSLERDIFLD